MSVSTLKYVSWLYGLKLWGKVSILFKAGISLVLGLTCNLVLFLKFFLIILIDWIMSEISKMEYSQEDGLWSHNSQSWILTVPLLNVCVWIRWWCSVAKSCLTLCDPWTATGLPCLSLSPGVCSDSFMSIESVMPSNHLIFCCPLVLLPSVFSSIRVFSNQLVFHIRWPNYWSFSFIISSSSEYSGLISLRMDWFDLAVQRTPKSLL